MKFIAVFCGSRTGNSTIYTHDAKLLVRAIHNHNAGIVYGGGNVGLMKVIADEAISLKMNTIGVITEQLSQRELTHKGITQTIVVKTMSERKSKMAELSHGFVSLAGGIGTMDEFFEMLTLQQLNVFNKPSALLNTNGYYSNLLDFMYRMGSEDFIDIAFLDSLIIDTNPQQLVEKIFFNLKI